MSEKLWRFTDNLGSFESYNADRIKSLYFPLANERIMSSVSPTLHGDIKTGHGSFLMIPVSRPDLANSRSSRNFWVYLPKTRTSWSACGVSKDIRQIEQDEFRLNAGLLWQQITRRNKEIGLQAKILSFIPAVPQALEIMLVELTNISSKSMELIPTAAIPIYGRSADNLRDHRHVTSLLQRARLDRFGVIAKPTLLFDEKGHHKNKDIYFVLGWDQKSGAPEYIYPTQEMFCQDDSDLESPAAVLKNKLPYKVTLQGKEAMGALRFPEIILPSSGSYSYIIVMGITDDESEIRKAKADFGNLSKVKLALEQSKSSWFKKSNDISFNTGDCNFDNWLRWVSIQPELRRIFGCSFLPDFDYGKGGRGWRDLWQDCLALILNNPKATRRMLVNNFGGIRIDGSNATIIGKANGEFIADRNNISRVWMDHGIWPLVTLELYLNETGDYGILSERIPYFRDSRIFRSGCQDTAWRPSDGTQLKTAAGRVYKGTILEHLLVENLVQFYNVGSHNYVRLEGADWNDGLDMAQENGESVAFSCMYAYNLALLAGLLSGSGIKKVRVFRELGILLEKSGYNNIRAKQKLLNRYFEKTSGRLSGNKREIDVLQLAGDLKEKSSWMNGYIRKKEWLKKGFFNGYYDNEKRRVEGKKKNLMRMSLASQTFPIMGQVADDNQIKHILKSVDKYLFDNESGGYRLNTDFKEQQLKLGRAFSFSYGDKENGAVFNHMVAMFAYALCRRGYGEEAWKVLDSIYAMATNTPKARIYPCIPEYFNIEGRGMYSYLTGSASWFMLTLATQIFGVRGLSGNLLIQPNLSASQFRHQNRISIRRIFAGRKLEVSFFNPKRLKAGRYRIIKASLNAVRFPAFPVNQGKGILIGRREIQRLAQGKTHKIDIFLG